MKRARLKAFKAANAVLLALVHSVNELKLCRIIFFHHGRQAGRNLGRNDFNGFVFVQILKRIHATRQLSDAAPLGRPHALKVQNEIPGGNGPNIGERTVDALPNQVAQGAPKAIHNHALFVGVRFRPDRNRVGVADPRAFYQLKLARSGEEQANVTKEKCRIDHLFLHLGHAHLVGHLGIFAPFTPQIDQRIVESLIVCGRLRQHAIAHHIGFAQARDGLANGVVALEIHEG